MLSLEAGNHVDRIRRIVQYGMDNPEVSAAVTLSWTRCINDYGLDPESKRLPPVLTQTELLERRERSRILLAEARQEMNILYQQLADPELAVVLVHTDGSILHMVAAASLEHNLSMLGLRPGAVWSEEQAGTNGMGTCLV
ncbi:MAG: sigma-54-dependent Fis family transcriptional regulator, partial [Pollutimonas bauzanensis]